MNEIKAVKEEKNTDLANKFSGLSIQEIEEFGSDVQLEITDTVNKILNDTKCIDVGSVGNSLNELAVVANKTTNSLTGNLFAIKIKKWIGRFDSIVDRLDTLEEGLDTSRKNLNTLLNALIDSKDYLSEQATKLKDLETSLGDYYTTIENDEDGLRKQAVANRLKTLTTLRVVTEQEVLKTVLVIQENKEITHQLGEAIINIMPMFKVQMMNTLALKANREALEIKKQLKKVANDLIIDNAKEIAKAADELIENRKSAIIDPKNIEEANSILQKTIEKVVDAAFVEADGNMQVVMSLRNSAEQLNNLRVKALENKGE